MKLPVWLLPILALAVAAAPAGASDCQTFFLEAEAAGAMRDADPEGGFQRGAAALARSEHDASDCRVAEAMLLASMGSNLHILARLTDAVDHYRQALDRLPEDATAMERARVHRGLGVVLAEQEAYDAALEHYLLALASSRDAGDVLEAAKVAANIGNLYNSLGQLERSDEYHRQALDDFEQAQYKSGIAGTLINLGALGSKFASDAADAGDTDAERRHYESMRDYNLRAAEIFTELGNDRGIAYAIGHVGLAAEHLGDPEQALVHHQRSLQLRERIGDVFGEINARLTMAQTLIRLSRTGQAEAHLQAAAAKIPDGNLSLTAALVGTEVQLAEARGDYREALRLQRELARLTTAMHAENHASRVDELTARFDSDRQAREIELLRRDAELRELELHRSRMLLHAGFVVGLLLLALFAVLVSRLRLRRMAARELERAARTDPVTTLANRRDMSERVDREIRRFERSGSGFSLVMADIDHFKAINDRYGHNVGDAVLLEVARRLRENLRGQDSLARWGGEEFLVLLPDTPRDGGRIVAAKLRDAVTDQPIVAHGHTIAVGLTMGMVECAEGMTMDDCIRLADEAMYAGKRQGRNRVVAHDAPTSPRGAGPEPEPYPGAGV